MNYIGSKYSLLPFIEEVFLKIRDDKITTFCDIFAGTGAVGRHFKQLGLRVIANDIQYYAYALNRAYLVINDTPAFDGLRKKYGKKIAQASEKPVHEVLAFVNALSRVKGFIARNYGPAAKRFYYTKANAEKADAIRQAIESWRKEGIISRDEYFYLLCSLLEAIDRVANTASVYGAFLKNFKSSALRPLTLKPLALSNHVKDCQVFQCDANVLIRKIECDLLYLDPPYNHRQYGANYHVLETVAAYDNPRLTGMTGMRDYPRSRYCQSKEARDALEDLVTKARTKNILMSYNDEGVLSLNEVLRILSLRGNPTTYRRNYTRFKADNGRVYKRDATVEYLHYVRVMK